jgi:hypothetical protein
MEAMFYGVKQDWSALCTPHIEVFGRTPTTRREERSLNKKQKKKKIKTETEIER